jgi:hypothetical protein
MTISRRKFTQQAGLAIVAAGVAGSAGTAFSQSLRSGDLFPLSAESFADPVMNFRSEIFFPYVGTIFNLYQDGARQNSLRLTEVFVGDQKDPGRTKADGACFSLLFRSISRTNLPENIYDFDHASLGKFSLFIAPVERAKKIFEAVIDHSSY